MPDAKPKPEKREYKPDKELIDDNGQRWFYFTEENIGLGLVGLEDPKTGSIISTSIVNSKKRVAAHRAWAGARQSRAAGMPWEILGEMGEKGVDPDEKLDETFQGYGHASVGDMARIPLDLSNVPLHLCYTLFNMTSINSGQEKSTRYQKRFGRAVLHQLENYLPNLKTSDLEPLEAQYQQLGELAMASFNKYKDILTQAYTEFYKPGETDQGALTARILDSARFFLPFGVYTGICLETSARDWARIVGELRASPVSYYHQVANQIQRLLTPTKEEESQLGFRAEAPSLLRHTEAAVTAIQNLSKLKAYLEKTDLLKAIPIADENPTFQAHKVELLSSQVAVIDRTVMQYILSIWPGLNPLQLCKWIAQLPDQDKEQIGQIIFAGHSNYKEMPPIAKTTGLSLVFHCYLGEMRDLNRHRSWGRFVPLPLVYGLKWDYGTARQIIAQGFGLPLYLTDVPEFDEIGHQFLKDLENYYQQLQDFIEAIKNKFGEDFDFSFVVNLLPLGHKVDLYMHGDPKQALYLTFQRTRPGGHINYRDLAYRANILIASSSPFFKSIKLPSPPQPGSREEFLDRS